MATYDRFDDMAVRSEIAEVYQIIEDELITNISRKFKNVSYEVGSPEWKDELLRQRRTLRRENRNIIKSHNKEIRGAVTNQLNSGAEQIINKNISYLKNTVSFGSRETVNQVVRAQAKAAVKGINLTNTKALNTVDRTFTRTVNKAFLEVSGGYKSSDQAVKDAVKTLGRSVAVTYKSDSGRITETSLDVAVRRDVRTATAKTMQQVQREKSEEWEIYLCQVSAHNGARPLCAAYQGEIYS